MTERVGDKLRKAGKSGKGNFGQTEFQIIEHQGERVFKQLKI